MEHDLLMKETFENTADLQKLCFLLTLMIQHLNL